MIRCENSNRSHSLFVIRVSQNDENRILSEEDNDTEEYISRCEESMREDFGRRKRIKRWTNFIAITALKDAFVTIPLLILLLRAKELKEISTLIGCMQISCHEFLSVISAWILLRCGSNHFDRIDAVGAWIIVHVIVLCGNVCLLTFETWDDYKRVFNSSYKLKLLLSWKLYFVLVEVIGMIYCYYIVHNPVVYIQEGTRRRHPLFPESNGRSNENFTTDTEITTPQESETIAPDIIVEELQQRRHCPRSAVIYDERPMSGRSNRVGVNNSNQDNKRTSCYDSYQMISSSTSDLPPRYTRNAAYESELSLEYANNYSPYDDMMLTNRNRLSFAESTITEDQNVKVGNV